MDLSRYIDILRRRLLIILLVTFIAVTVVATVGFFTKPKYQTSAVVRILEDVGVQDFNVIRDSYGRLTKTYGDILTSSPMLKEAISRLNASISVQDLREQISIEIRPGTELMNISVISEDPEFAQAMANQLAALLIEYVQNLYTVDSSGSRQIEQSLTELEAEIEQDRQVLAKLISDTNVTEAQVELARSTIDFKEDSYRNMLLLFHSTRLGEELRANSVKVVTQALLPTIPTNRYGLKEVGLGLLIGLFSGLGLALVLENLDTRIYNAQHLENLTGLPVVGMVSKGTLLLSDSENQESNHYRRLQDAYRLLAFNLNTLREQVSLQTIMITSAIPHEGKSTVAVNLSRVLAERGQTVFLLEADMRRPSLSEKLAATNGHTSTGEGLSDLLTDRGVLDEYKLSQILHITDQPSLFFVGGGTSVANPTALLASPRMGELLQYFGSQGQMTLVDTPPILGVADVSVISAQVDGVVLVVSQGVSHREDIIAAVRQLQAVQANILGFVFIKDSHKKPYE